MKIINLKKIVQLEQIWFNEDTDFKSKADVIEFRESHINYEGKLSGFLNAVIDLSKPSQDIFDNFDKGFKYEVRRAEKEGISCEQIYCTDVQLKSIYNLYRKFSIDRNIPFIAVNLFFKYFEQALIKTTGALYKGKTIQIHIYFSDQKEDILLASFPTGEIVDLKNAMVGYANRLLHWFDIQLAIQEKKTRYNLGGIGNGVFDSKKQGIAKFKYEMNPDVIEYYHGLVINSIKGKLLFFIKKNLNYIYAKIFNKDN